MNITVKANTIFSPTWDIVLAIKNNKITEGEYTKLYTNIMRKSYKNNFSQWQKILNLDRILFCCFCHKDNFCHRKVLADIFTKLGAEYKGEL